MAKTPPEPHEKPQMDWLHDYRTDCFSALVKLTTGKYLELVKDAHEQRGGIAGQREVLKTSTAKRVRDRMISDIRAGADAFTNATDGAFDGDSFSAVRPSIAGGA